MKEVRCPDCHKKLAEHLEGGFLVKWCSRCRAYKIFDRRKVDAVA
jgi:phage FluMu protein Com